MSFKVPMEQKLFYLIRKSFQNDEEWRLFIVRALLVTELFKILIYAN